MVKERRTFERYSCAILGSCVGNTNIPMGVKCHDIGAAGAGLASAENLPEGTRLRINLCTKADKPLLLKGIVRWCDKTPDEWQAGVEFHKPALFPLAMVL